MIQPLRIVGATVHLPERLGPPWGNKGDPYAIRELNLTDRVIAQPHANALTVDLSGYTIYPGLINAHDHLELNHYPRTKYQERYGNSHQWGEQVNSQLDKPPFKELRAYPLEDRLFIGGIKNLLSGVTLVAHHNPPHKPLFRRDFPVRVLKKYGWAHSLHFAPQAEIIDSYRRTPKGAPWFIHLAEGTDETALAEYQQLKALGCMSDKTVLVHAVGMSRADWADAANIYTKGVRFVWCPTTNRYLLGETVSYVALGRYAHPCLGSDSRLTADGDLLDELRFAEVHWNTRLPASPGISIRLVTENAASILRTPNSGHLHPGAHGDCVAVGDKPLYECRRADLTLVVRGGVPQIGDPEVMAKFPHIPAVDVLLDGIPKRMNGGLARQVAHCSLQEPGLRLLQKPITSRTMR